MTEIIRHPTEAFGEEPANGPAGITRCGDLCECWYAEQPPQLGPTARVQAVLRTTDAHFLASLDGFAVITSARL